MAVLDRRLFIWKSLCQKMSFPVGAVELHKLTRLFFLSPVQHHLPTQGSGGFEPGLSGISGPAAGLLSRALRGGVALGPRRKRPAVGHRSRSRGHRHLQGRLQFSQQVCSTPTMAVCILKRALCGFGREYPTQNCNIYNINEIIIQTHVFSITE